MTPDMMQQMISILDEEEGYKKRAYLDGYGNITVGRGHNLSAHDVEEDIIDRWSKSDILDFYNKWHSNFGWFIHLDEIRQMALIDFSFQGWQHVLSFEKMLNYLSKNDMKGAAEEILNSEYAKQVGKRAERIARRLITGEL